MVKIYHIRYGPERLYIELEKFKIREEIRLA